MKNKLYNLFLVLFLTRILESDAFLIEKKLSAKLQKVKETNLNNYFTSPESKLVKVGSEKIILNLINGIKLLYMVHLNLKYIIIQHI